MLPPNKKDPQRKRIRRRLDLIFAAPESYWTAVIGWYVTFVHYASVLMQRLDLIGLVRDYLSGT